MNTYNLTIILDGKTTAAKKKTAVEKLTTLVSTYEGTLGEIEDLGERELAYQINKSTSGIYLNLPLTIQGEAAKKLMDKVRLEEYVLRYLLVRNEEKKTAEKVKKVKKSQTKSTESEK